MTGAGCTLDPAFGLLPDNVPELRRGDYAPGRILNEYSLLLPGEEEALRAVPTVSAINYGGLTAKSGARTVTLQPGEVLDGWRLITIAGINGVETAVFEKHVTHRGAIAYVTERQGIIAWI